MATTAQMNEDPLSIFDEMIDNAVAQDQGGDNPASGNPFDPLVVDGSSSNNSDNAIGSSDGLDLLSQIASWGAENKDPAAEDQEMEEAPSTPTKETTPSSNVMAADDKAVELSDDLVASAHQEFEATADKLAEFEQKEEQQEQHAQ